MVNEEIALLDNRGLRKPFLQMDVVGNAGVGVDLRPAFPDNLPRIRRLGRTIYANGLYRHGFLLAPAMATRAAGMLIPEIEDADHRERRTA